MRMRTARSGPAKGFRKRSAFPVASTLCLVIGLFLGGWQIAEVRADQQLLRHGVSVAGTVEDTYLSQRGTGGGRPSKTVEIAVVRYVPASGNPFTVHHVVKPGGKLPGGDDAPPGRVGQDVTVYYTSGDPADSVVAGWQETYDWYFYLTGLLVLLAGSAVLRSGLRHFRKPQPLAPAGV